MRHLTALLSLFAALLWVPSMALGQATSSTTNAQTQRSGADTQGNQAAGASAAKSAGPVLRRSNRMEFDGRLIKGEKATGAVYLFQRVPRRLPPLLKLKRDELDRIVWPVLRRNADRPTQIAKTGKPKTPKVALPKSKAKPKQGAKARKGKKPYWRKKNRWRRPKVNKPKVKKKK